MTTTPKQPPPRPPSVRVCDGDLSPGGVFWSVSPDGSSLSRHVCLRIVRLEYALCPARLFVLPAGDGDRILPPTDCHLDPGHAAAESRARLASEEAYCRERLRQVEAAMRGAFHAEKEPEGGGHLT